MESIVSLMKGFMKEPRPGGTKNLQNREAKLRVFAIITLPPEISPVLKTQASVTLTNF